MYKLIFLLLIIPSVSQANYFIDDVREDTEIDAVLFQSECCEPIYNTKVVRKVNVVTKEELERVLNSKPLKENPKGNYPDGNFKISNQEVQEIPN
ncbi:hypothetical protein [Proteus phage J3S]